jgi:hypothetical protein
LAFWEEGIVDNYNYSEPPYIKRDNVKITLFNTSHIKANNLSEKAFELHEAQGWVKELWHD